MKLLKTLLAFGLIFFTTEIIGQELFETYQTTLNGIVTNFETIRGTTSIKDGKNSIRVISKNKVVLSVEHKRKVKNLTFLTKKDEEGQTYWASGNPLTRDMIDKYDDFVTDVLETMLKLSEKKAQE
jgi:hypothetical protein